MMDDKNSNIYQAKQAAEEVRRYKCRTGLDPSEKRAAAREAAHQEKRSHTFRPQTVAAAMACRYCHEEGHQIKTSGVLTCPKLVAKEQRTANEQAKRSARERTRQDAWSKQLQDTSGCSGEGWKTAGIKSNLDSWRERQLAKQEEEKISYKRQQVVQNRFDLPSDSEDEEEDRRPRLAEPLKLAASNSWSKGAPSGHEVSQLPTRKPIASWADECDSD